MSKLSTGNEFLSGFGTQNMLEDYYLKPGVQGNDFLKISEDDENYEIEVDLPGYDKDDLSLLITNGEMVLSGVNPVNEAGDRANKGFKQTIHLPKEIDNDKITSNFNKENLKITIPKP